MSLVSGATSLNLGGALITVTEGNNDTAANSTITVHGTDMLGNSLTEVIVGPAQSGTSTGTKAFATVSRIDLDVAFTSTKVKIGYTASIGDDFTSRGKLELSNSTGTPIKVETVAADSNTNMRTGVDGTFAQLKPFFKS